MVHVSQRAFSLCNAEPGPEVWGPVSIRWLEFCQAAGCTLLSVGEAAPPQPTAERPFLLYPNPGFSSLPCSLWNRAQFIHVHHFISSREFTEQPYASSLEFKTLPSKLKWVWKLVIGLEAEKQLKHLTQSLSCISSAPQLGSLCHYTLESWAFFSSKCLKKCDGFVSHIFFFPEVGGWWLVYITCSLVLACGANPSLSWRTEQRLIQEEPGWCNHSHPVCWELGLTCGISQTFLKKDLGIFYLA